MIRMLHCYSCGAQVQAEWANCPHCSAPFDTESQQPPVDRNLYLQFIAKKKFALVPTVTVYFRDPVYGVEEQVVFHQKTRKFLTKTSDGFLLGTIKMNGTTIFEGFSGMVTFRNGTSYSVDLELGFTGAKAVKISDLTDGRNCSIEV